MIDATPPKYPKAVERNGEVFLRLEDGREYEVPDDPMKVLGLLHHLSGKTWADRSFFFHAIQRIARAKGWEIHPWTSSETSTSPADVARSTPWPRP